MNFHVSKKQCLHVIEKNLFILWMLTKGTQMHMINYLKRHVNMLALCSELASPYSSPTQTHQDETPTNTECSALICQVWHCKCKRKKEMQKKHELPYSQLLSTAVRLTDCNLNLKASCMFIHVLINAFCTPKYKWSITQHTYFLYPTLVTSF